jgi:arginine-tRNA-protein transferase
MTLPGEHPLQRLQFYVTAPFPCGYLENLTAQSLIATPHHLINAKIYNHLIQNGFRRSGKFAYRPHCESCNACLPVRLLVNEFVPNRSQRRAAKLHQNLSVSILPLAFSEEHFALYSTYQTSRHSGGGMDQATADQYHDFLVQSNIDSMMIEFRSSEAHENGKLKMVSVVDIVSDGISAVYTFFDTGDTATSYGTYNVLWQIEWCRSLQLPYLYLGYWIEKSQKMVYKQNFAPQQGLIRGEWQRLNTHVKNY